MPTHPSSRIRQFLCVTGVLLLGPFLLSSCGGGSGSSGGGNPPPPDFSLSVPANASVQQGSSATVSVGVTGANGFASQVSITISSLPTGVTATPSQFSIGAGDQQQLVIAASGTAAAATTNLQVAADSGSLQHSGQISLTVTASAPPPPTATRIRYDQTDTQWDTSFLSFFPQPLILYDAPTKRFFLSDTSLNRVEVFDATTQQQISEIAVPGAFVADESADHKTIYMGTQVGDIYEIDPVAMKVLKRIPSTQIGPSGYAAYQVRALSDGRLVLLGGQGGIPAVDGYSNFAVWNPSSNTLQEYSSSYGSTESGTTNPPVCGTLENIAETALTADRTKILISSADSDGTLCLFDPNTLTQQLVMANNGRPILVPADGKEILIVTGNVVTVYDSAGLFQTDQFQVDASLASDSCVLSPDGNTLYVVGQNGLPGQVYNWRTHQRLGWFASFSMFDLPELMGPTAMVVDETGLIANSIGHGIAFLDGAVLQPQAPANVFSFGYANVLQPTFGPAQGGTQALITGVGITDVKDVAFGTQPATVVSKGPLGITVDTPASAPGPVDVSMTANDGSYLLLPRGYSYGPSLVEATTNASTAEGGSTGTIYGYGFGSATENGQASDLQVSIGGHLATITQYSPQPFSQATPYYPFPLEAVQFTIPAGNAGQTAAVTISNSSGSTTTPGAIQYLPAIQQYPLAGAVLAQGIYDSKRDLYYFTDQTQLRVFSRTKGQWLAPIPMPSGAQRLFGISLSPDGSKLAVSDAGTNRIYTFDPDTPAAVSTFPLPNTGFDLGEEPCGLAILDSGIVYFATFALDYTGNWALHKLDISTGNVTDFHNVQDGNLGGDAYIRMLLTNDNTRVYLNVGGAVIALDTATDTLFTNPILAGGDYELTLSSNQTWMSGTEYLMDTNLNPESYVAYIDREIWNQTAVYGEKISPDGNLLFVPLLNGLDVIDGRLGGFRTRIALPVTLSANYDALVSDGKDNVLIAITGTNGNGIAVIDLTSLPEPVPLPWQAAESSSLHPLATWTARPAKNNPRLTASKLSIKDTVRIPARLRHIAISPAIKRTPR